MARKPFDLWLATEEAFYLTRFAGREPRPDAGVFWSWLAAQASAGD